jgi:hypothetical protein
VAYFNFRNAANGACARVEFRMVDESVVDGCAVLECDQLALTVG